jgi:hypothetical protein
MFFGGGHVEFLLALFCQQFFRALRDALSAFMP